jgi:hypothetical protein
VLGAKRRDFCGLCHARNLQRCLEARTRFLKGLIVGER